MQVQVQVQVQGSLYLGTSAIVCGVTKYQDGLMQYLSGNLVLSTGLIM